MRGFIVLLAFITLAESSGYSRALPPRGAASTIQRYPPLIPTDRAPPRWPYNWTKFPALWFGANVSGFETESQLQEMGKFSMILLGWQHMQVYTNYSHLLQAQVSQLKIIKAKHPNIPTFVYIPVSDASPFYESYLPLFDDMEAYKNVFFLDKDGSLYNQTMSHKCSGGIDYPSCVNVQFNYFNSTARNALFAAVENLAEMDPAGVAFDGMFFDAGTKFLRRDFDGAANLPVPPPSDEDVLEIETGLLHQLINISSVHGRYPAFNSRLQDMNLTTGVEQRVMNSIGSRGMFRFYECKDSSIAFIDNALAERSISLHTLLNAHASQPIEGQIAIFLLIRSEYYYFGYHSSYYDAGYQWHPEFDVLYGTPTSEPARTAGKLGKTVVYTRSYTHCNVRIVCESNQPCKGTVTMASR